MFFSSSLPRAVRRVSAIAVAALLVALMSGLTLANASPARADSAPTDPTNPATPTTVTNDVLPTPQIDGVAWAQVVVGNTVYVAGKFTTARPYGSAPGVNTVPRNNLLAYDVTTGNLISSFAPSLNAQALAITASPDGTRVYVVGDFTAVDGAAYYRIAAFNTTTGKIVPSFRPILGAQTRTVSATNSVVYTGGVFTIAAGQSRGYGAAFNAADGSITPWDPKADSTIQASALTPSNSKLVIGGRFGTLSGVEAKGLGAVDTTTGANVPWAMQNIVKDYSSDSAITSLSASGDRIYGTGYDYSFPRINKLEGAFSADAETGNTVWIEDCHGDSYSVWALGDAVYTSGHAHFCGNIGGFPDTNPRVYHHTIAFSKNATGTVAHDTNQYTDFGGQPAPSLLTWYPAWVPGSFTGQYQAVWSLAGNSRYLVAGGEFPSVNGVQQQGLTRFAVPSAAPNKSGPSGNNALNPRLVSDTPGAVRVAWTATYDSDNENLTYSVVRDKSANTAPIYTTTASSTFWQRPTLSFTDTGLTPGSSHYYRVFATDPFGNVVNRASGTITVASAATQPAYVKAVHSQGATSYWPLDESSGTYALDHAGADDLTVGTPVTRGADGPISGSTASTFSTPGNAAPYGVASSQNQIAGPNTFTVSAWFKTTSTSGGKIVGFGDQQSTVSGSYDRHVYLDDSGRVYFGVYPNFVATVNSAPGFNDGQWHQVVASLGGDGMKLWLDAKLVGSRGDVTGGQDYKGYWRIGGDNTNGWPGADSSWFSGSIGQVSLYPNVLSRAQVTGQWTASGRTAPGASAPSDAYGAAVYNQEPTLFWRLGDSSGTAADSGGGTDTGTYEGGYTQGVDGAVGSGKAVAFDGGRVISTQQITNPTTYSLEGWFKTTTTSGGKIIGFGDASSGFSGNYDRHIYMRDDGRVDFGVWTGFENLVTSPAPLNDGRWHHVVATQGSAGMALYIDGSLAGTNPQTNAQAYSGYWRIGGDSSWNSSSASFAGSIDEVAVYPTVLSASDVSSHYGLGTGTGATNTPPRASFTASTTKLTTAFDASGSTDADGTIASYTWNFGDGGTGSGPTTGHTYAAGGTYTVTLTVTDDKGATDSTSKQVIAVANRAPTASFTTTPTGLSVFTDATASADADGQIASYAWTFGDGGTATGATATHAYASAGTYVIGLTVTDDEGATGSTTRTVSVTAPNQAPSASFTDSGKLAHSFDGSTSSDPDGSIASYAWDFGDGASGSGRTTTHTYASSGTFAVTLTVTDNGGATAKTTRQVAVGANAAPQPSFTASAAGLTVTADASASSDSDGRVVSYAWDFGDRTSASGVTTSHTYGASGTYTIGLTVTDDDGATASTTRTVAVTAPNQSPSASFTSSGSGLTASFDASASNDSDGSIASYGWTFGDATSGTGRTTTHAYAQAGTYTVVLTATDNVGATSSTTQQVTVTAPSTGTFAADAFERSTSGGWGTSDQGGAWTVSGTASSYSVSTGSGRTTVPAGATRTALLSGVSVPDADLTATTRLDALPTGGGAYLRVIPRQVGTANYSGTAWVRSNGSVVVILQQGSTTLQQYTVPGLTVAAGGALKLHVRVSGSAPSTLQASVWSASSSEPSNWQVQATDSSGPQSAGSVGLQAYLSSSATAPFTAAFDDLSARRVTTTPANVAPTAAFSATSSGLTGAFDASASADSDGSIASYSWAFGDGANATGRTTTHAYPASGTYSVVVTVTDDKGATGSTTQSITVTTPPSEAIAADAFARTTSNGWGAADAGGSWTTSGAASAWSTNGQAGLVAVTPGSTKTATLAGVSSSSTDTSVSFAADTMPTGGSTYVSVIGRSAAGSNYQARTLITVAGGVQLQLLGKSGAVLKSSAISGLTYAAGTVLDVRLQVTGTSPTTIQAKVWLHGTAEPSAWQVSATDADGPQTAGAVGLGSYISASATATTVRFTGYAVRSAQ